MNRGEATDAILDSKCNGNQVAILLGYLRHMPSDVPPERGISWPGPKLLARYLGGQESTVKTHRTKLLKAGVLVIAGRTEQGGLKCRIDFEALAAFKGTQTKRSTPNRHSTPSEIRTPSERRTGGVRNTDGMVSETRTGTRPNDGRGVSETRTQTLSREPSPENPPQGTLSRTPPQSPPRGGCPPEPSAPKQPVLVSPVELPAPKLPELPQWAKDAKPKRCSRRRLAEVLLEVVSAVTRRPLEREWAEVVGQEFRKGTQEYRTIKASRAAGLVGGCLSLLRRLKWPDIEEWRTEALVVAAAFHDCPDRLFARDVRAEGWAKGTNRSESTKTFARQDVWEDRVTAALRWDANGRPPTPGGGARPTTARVSAVDDFSIPDSIPFRAPSSRRSA